MKKKIFERAEKYAIYILTCLIRIIDDKEFFLKKINIHQKVLIKFSYNLQEK